VIGFLHTEGPTLWLAVPSRPSRLRDELSNLTLEDAKG
jgi:hypothetical protein